MANVATKPQQSLESIAKGDGDLLNTLMRIQEGTLRESGLDPETFMMVRGAALATLDAAPASWMANLALVKEAKLTSEQVLATLIAIAPTIGTARVVAAAGNILRAMGLAEAITESSDS